MEQLRPVSKREKIIFPIAVTLVCGLVLPDALPLLGMLMLGNLLKESLVTERLAKTASNELINIVTIFLGLIVGTKAVRSDFLAAADSAYYRSRTACVLLRHCRRSADG